MEYDWSGLDELRVTYLEGTAGAADYWTSDTLLAGYDATFARRIAWKWQHVFRDLRRVGWSPPEAAAILDWGCGTGVAVREFLAAWEAGSQDGTGSPPRKVALHDRSRRAVAFAAAAVRREFPGTEIVSGSVPEDGFILLVSHVLTELPEAALAELTALARRAEAVLWVEPGTPAASRPLVQVREALRGTFYPVAPCLHRCRCGLLEPGHENDWCHFFATPPNEVFTDGEWVQFGRIMGIDLRSLPLSYLVLDRREPPPPPPHAVRVIGRQRLYKGHALLDGCDATGVNERRFTKRTAPAFFRAMVKGRTGSLHEWELKGSEITAVREAGNSTGQEFSAPPPGG